MLRIEDVNEQEPRVTKIAVQTACLQLADALINEHAKPDEIWNVLDLQMGELLTAHKKRLKRRVTSQQHKLLRDTFLLVQAVIGKRYDDTVKFEQALIEIIDLVEALQSSNHFNEHALINLEAILLGCIAGNVVQFPQFKVVYDMQTRFHLSILPSQNVITAVNNADKVTRVAKFLLRSPLVKYIAFEVIQIAELLDLLEQLAMTEINTDEVCLSCCQMTADEFREVVEALIRIRKIRNVTLKFDEQAVGPYATSLFKLCSSKPELSSLLIFGRDEYAKLYEKINMRRNGFMDAHVQIGIVLAADENTYKTLVSLNRLYAPLEFLLRRLMNRKKFALNDADYEHLCEELFVAKAAVINYGKPTEAHLQDFYTALVNYAQALIPDCDKAFLPVYHDLLVAFHRLQDALYVRNAMLAKKGISPYPIRGNLDIREETAKKSIMNTGIPPQHGEYEESLVIPLLRLKERFKPFKQQLDAMQQKGMMPRLLLAASAALAYQTSRLFILAHMMVEMQPYFELYGLVMCGATNQVISTYFDYVICAGLTGYYYDNVRGRFGLSSQEGRIFAFNRLVDIALVSTSSALRENVEGFLSVHASRQMLLEYEPLYMHERLARTKALSQEIVKTAGSQVGQEVVMTRQFSFNQVYVRLGEYINGIYTIQAHVDKPVLATSNINVHKRLLTAYYSVPMHSKKRVAGLIAELEYVLEAVSGHDLYAHLTDTEVGKISDIIVALKYDAAIFFPGFVDYNKHILHIWNYVFLMLFDCIECAVKAVLQNKEPADYLVESREFAQLRNLYRLGLMILAIIFDYIKVTDDIIDSMNEETIKTMRFEAAKRLRYANAKVDFEIKLQQLEKRFAATKMIVKITSSVVETVSQFVQEQRTRVRPKPVTTKSVVKQSGSLRMARPVKKPRVSIAVTEMDPHLSYDKQTRELMSIGQFDQAIECAQSALHRFKVSCDYNHAACHARIAGVYLTQAQYSKSLSAKELYVLLMKVEASFKAARGICMLARKAAELNSEDIPNSVIMLEDEIDQQLTTLIGEYGKALAVPDQHFYARKYAQALQKYEAMSNDGGASSKLVINMAYCHRYMGNAQRGISMLREFLAKHDSEEAKLALAIICSSQRENTAASKLFDELRTLKSPEYYTAYFRYLVQSRQFEELADELEVFAPAENLPWIIALKAEYYSILGDQHRAGGYFEKLWVVASRHAGHAIKYAKFKFLCGDAKAIQIIERILQDKPHHVQAKMVRAEMLAECNQHALAIEEIDTVIAQCPGYVQASVSKVYILRMCNRFADANVLVGELKMKYPNDWSCNQLVKRQVNQAKGSNGNGHAKPFVATKVMPKVTVPPVVNMPLPPVAEKREKELFVQLPEPVSQLMRAVERLGKIFVSQEAAFALLRGQPVTDKWKLCLFTDVNVREAVAEISKHMRVIGEDCHERSYITGRLGDHRLVVNLHPCALSLEAFASKQPTTVDGYLITATGKVVIPLADATNYLATNVSVIHVQGLTRNPTHLLAAVYARHKNGTFYGERDEEIIKENVSMFDAMAMHPELLFALVEQCRKAAASGCFAAICADWVKYGFLIRFIPRLNIIVEKDVNAPILMQRIVELANYLDHAIEVTGNEKLTVFLIHVLWQVLLLTYPNQGPLEVMDLIREMPMLHSLYAHERDELTAHLCCWAEFKLYQEQAAMVYHPHRAFSANGEVPQVVYLVPVLDGMAYPIPGVDLEMSGQQFGEQVQLTR